jgi:hypothetical protein
MAFKRLTAAMLVRLSSFMVIATVVQGVGSLGMPSADVEEINERDAEFERHVWGF